MKANLRNETGMFFVFCQVRPMVPPQVPNWMNMEIGNWKFETGNSKLENGGSKIETRKSKLEIGNSKIETRKSKCAGREATGGIEVFRSIEHSLRGRTLVAREKKDGRQGRAEKKCEKMRFEATTLLKTREVDLERTQIRTHRWTVFWAKMGGIGPFGAFEFHRPCDIHIGIICLLR